MPKRRTKVLHFKKQKQQFAAMATSAVNCDTNPVFLSAFIIAGFLSLLITVELRLFVFGWILVTTGLHPMRLSELVYGNGGKLKKGVDVHFDRKTGWISYFVRNNGNDRNKGSSGPDRVTIQLPRFIRLLMPKGKKPPFTNIIGRFNYRATRFYSVQGGESPTAYRMAQSFRRWVLPSMKDDLVGYTLSGYIKGSHSPQSHYVRFDNREVNNRQQKGVKAFVKVMRRQSSVSTDLLTYLSNVHFESKGPQYPIGPRNIVTRLELDELDGKLRRRIQAARRKTKKSDGLDQLVAIARLTDLQGAHLFQTLRFSNALRETALRCVIHTSEHLDFSITEDKDASFNEARLLPRLESERKQQRINQQTIAVLLMLAKRAGVKVKYHKKLLARGYAVSATLSRPRRGQATLTLKPFTQKIFNAVLEAEGISNPCPKNANRIYLGTHLRRKVRQLLLDQLLGHNRANHDVFSPLSSASLTRTDFDQLVNKLHRVFTFRTSRVSLRHIPGSDTVNTDIMKTLKKLKAMPFPKMPAKNSKPKPRRKSSRPATHPAKHENVKHLPNVIAAYDFMWSTEIPNKPAHHLYHVSVALGLSLEFGVDNPYLSLVMSKAQWGDVRDDFTLLKIPFDRGAVDTPHFTLPLVKSVALMIKALYMTRRPASSDYVFVPHITETAGRRSALKRQLAAEWKILKQDFKKAHPGRTLPGLKEVLSIGKLYALFETGIEQFIFSLHASAMTPTTHSGRKQEPHTTDELCAPGQRLRWMGNFSKTFMQRATRESGLSPDVSGHSFLKEANIIFTDLRKGLKTIATTTAQGKLRPKKKVTLKRVDSTLRVHDLIDGLMLRADAIAPDRFSAVHLALSWLRHRYDRHNVEDNLQYRSVNTYLGRVFGTRLLRLAKADSLPDIEPELLLGKIDTWINKEKIKPRTRKYIRNRFRAMLSFGVRAGFFPEITMHGDAGMEAIGTTRNDIVDPDFLDKLVDPLMASRLYRDREQALMIILAHYAGLRADEIENLTINDVVTTPSQCWIYIRCGKTKRARRVIALHRFTRMDHVAFIHACRGVRHQRFVERAPEPKALESVYLLGPQSYARGHTRYTLTDPVIVLLKQHFGSDVDLHLLRHGFASWLVVRIMALRYPELTDGMPIKDHWLLSERRQCALRQWLTLDTDDWHPLIADLLLRVGRVMGHNGIDTLFGFYVQTFVHLQRHAARRADACFEQRVISRRMACALFTRIRSPRIFRRHGHTVAGMLASQRARVKDDMNC